MAAYDLIVQKPAQLAIPNTFNQSASNVLNSVRLAQQQKNEEDRLALDNAKEANRSNEAKALQLLRERTQQFAEGSDARAKQGRIDTNQSLEQALMSARNQLGGQFNFTDANRAAIENDIRFAKMTDDQKAQFWNDARAKMVGDIGKHTDPRLYERAIRAQYANTDATPEMIDQAVQNEMNRVYGVADNDLMKTLARSAVGGSSGGGLNKPPEFDNVRNYVDAADYVQKWSERAGVEKGDGGWFDFGDTDLTEQNVARYIASMRNRFGFNEVESLNALDTMRDGDTVNIDFNEVMNADVNGNSAASQTLKKLYDVGNSMRQTRTVGTGSGGSNQNQALQVMQMINGTTRRGTTEAQRRDLLFTMLTERMGVAEAKKQTEALTESKVPEKVVKEVKNKPSDNMVSAMEAIVGNSANHRNPSILDPVETSYFNENFSPNAPANLTPDLAKGLAAYLNQGN